MSRNNPGERRYAVVMFLGDRVEMFSVLAGNFRDAVEKLSASIPQDLRKGLIDGSIELEAGISLTFKEPMSEIQWLGGRYSPISRN